jgi:hypothetical protein
MSLTGILTDPDAWPSLPSTRKAALETGVSHYFTPGRACIRGHVAPRRTGTGNCTLCLRAAATERRALLRT